MHIKTKPMFSGMKLGVRPWDSWHSRLQRVCYCTHSPSHKPRLAPLLSCCCPSHGTSISKLLRSTLKLSCTFTNTHFWALFSDSDLSTWCQFLTSLYDPLSPGTFSSIEAAHSQMPWPAHLLDQAMLSMVPSRLQNQYHLGICYTLWSVAASTRLCLAPSASCLLRKCFMEDFTLVTLVSS